MPSIEIPVILSCNPVQITGRPVHVKVTLPKANTDYTVRLAMMTSGFSVTPNAEVVFALDEEPVAPLIVVGNAADTDFRPGVIAPRNETTICRLAPEGIRAGSALHLRSTVDGAVVLVTAY